MPRLFAAALAAVTAVLAACAPSPYDRIAELDERVTIDCGSVDTGCTPTAKANELIQCLKDNLAAGIVAKGEILDIDIVEDIYTLDGQLVSVAGYSEDGDDMFWESRCLGVEASGGPVCSSVITTGCQTIHEW